MGYAPYQVNLVRPANGAGVLPGEAKVRCDSGLSGSTDGGKTDVESAAMRAINQFGDGDDLLTPVALARIPHDVLESALRLHKSTASLFPDYPDGLDRVPGGCHLALQVG